MPEFGAVADWALELVAGLNFGAHKRPSRAEAAELAVLVEAAHTDHGLSEAEIRRYSRTAVNEAKKSAVSYLRNALHADRLPIPVAETKGQLVESVQKVRQGVEVPAYQEWRAAMDRKKPRLAKSRPIAPQDATESLAATTSRAG